VARGLNKVLLIGNLGSDPNASYTPDGVAVSRFSLATGSTRKGPNGQTIQETEWHRIVCFDKLAEIANEYCFKGKQVYVEGRIQSRKYTDNQGVERVSFDIVAREITLLGGGQREGTADEGSDDYS
jgi:single-strand DNA-binding protein